MLTQAQWANFSSEMTAIREKVDLEIASKYIDGQKVDIFTESVPINDLPNSLKREMLYIMDGMKDKKKPKDFDEEDLNFLADKNGNLKGFHYIRAGLSDGESKKYIYDEDRDVIYKVKGTRILGTTLHTYEYACKLKGVPFRSIANNSDYIINQGSAMVKTGNLAYYAPDLENFRTGVLSIVYHKKNKISETKEVPYYLSGISPEVTINQGILGREQTYVWYDYSEDRKMWANVKCESANEIVSYWTWIPRYAYKITERKLDEDDNQLEPGSVDIKFVDVDNRYYDTSSNSYKTLEAGYTVAAAFEQNGQHLKGIWMSKYAPSYISVDGFKLSTMEDPKQASNAPDLSNFNPEKTYYVTYQNNGTSGNEIATLIKDNNEPENWYDYTQKKWANIKCVNTSEANGKDLVSYWTWVPSYAYRVTQGQLEIIYVKYDTTQNKWVACDPKYNNYTIGTGDNDFKVLAAFEQNNQHLNGIWMSKYEPSMISNEYEKSTDATAVNAPDLSNFNPAKTYYIEYKKNNKGNEYEDATIVQGNNPPENWYDYTAKKWANIKCVNTVNGKDLVSYWTWVPSYAYRVTQGQLEVIYVKYDNTTNKWVPCDSKYNTYAIGTGDNDFKVLAAFEQGGQHLDGIWMSKYQPSKIDK